MWEPSSRYPDPSVQVLDPAFNAYRLPLASVERLATGCRWSEGPVYFGDGRYLLWSDIPNDRILKWEEETGAVSVFRKTSYNANGNTRDRQGRLVTCEHRGRRVSRTEYDDARFRLMADQQMAAALKVTAAVALTKLGGDATVDVRTMTDYLQASARVDELQRQLDHTVIHAPFSGIVTQVETVQPGMYLAAATAAFGLVSEERVWIEANPKETELTHVKPGDPVAVTVDTYPGRVWQARVESIAPNSGSEFSVLPAQNTSGNWVKVVQRIPVRIAVERKDGDPVLRAGSSVIADIDTGHRRSWRDLF